jgi:hypothetical protein
MPRRMRRMRGRERCGRGGRARGPRQRQKGINAPGNGTEKKMEKKWKKNQFPQVFTYEMHRKKKKNNKKKSGSQTR